MERFSTIKISTLIAKFRYERLTLVDNFFMGNADKILILYKIQGISPCLISTTSEVNVYTLVHFVGHCISWGIYPFKLKKFYKLFLITSSWSPIGQTQACTDTDLYPRVKLM